MEERRRSDKGVTHKGARGRWHNRGRLTDNGLGAFMLEHRDLTTHLPLRLLPITHHPSNRPGESCKKHDQKEEEVCLCVKLEVQGPLGALSLGVRFSFSFCWLEEKQFPTFGCTSREFSRVEGQL